MRLDVLAFPIPSQEGLIRKPMPQVVNPGTKVIRRGPQATFAGGEDEPAANGEIIEPGAPFREGKNLDF
jgi:hypothetical protein